jgi:hypothetical protein
MTQDEVSQQTLIENGLLKGLVDGLRSTLGWQVQGTDCSRKLSTLRFMAECFQRHLERMMSLEEFDGYMAHVMEISPYLSRRVEALRGEHGLLRETARHVLHRLEQVSPSDPATFADVCDELRGLLEKVETHSRKEVHLVQEACTRDSGGEG